MAKDTFPSFKLYTTDRTTNKELLLGINSNLGVPDKLIDKIYC